MNHQIKIPPNHTWRCRKKRDSGIEDIICLVMILVLTLVFYILVA